MEHISFTFCAQETSSFTRSIFFSPYWLCDSEMPQRLPTVRVWHFNIYTGSARGLTLLISAAHSTAQQGPFCIFLRGHRRHHASVQGSAWRHFGSLAEARRWCHCRWRHDVIGWTGGWKWLFMTINLFCQQFGAGVSTQPVWCGAAVSGVDGLETLESAGAKESSLPAVILYCMAIDFRELYMVKVQT